MTEEITEAVRNAFNEYLNAVDKIILENQALQIELQHLKQENETLKKQYNCYACDTCNGKEDYRNMKRHCENAIKTVHNYRYALEEILESVKFAQCLPCGSGNLEDCLNCNDDTTNNGQFCMEKRIHDIKTKCVEVLNDN